MSSRAGGHPVPEESTIIGGRLVYWVPAFAGTTVGGSVMSNSNGPLRVGVGGPVGSGKTALMDALCKRLRDRFEIAAITNDIYTKWDAEYLVRSGALASERIAGVE